MAEVDQIIKSRSYKVHDWCRSIPKVVSIELFNCSKSRRRSVEMSFEIDWSQEIELIFTTLSFYLSTTKVI